MNRPALRTTLHRMEVPPPDPAASERALHRALIALQHRDAPSQVPTRWRAWAGGALVLGCLVVALLMYDRSGQPSQLASQRKLLRKMEALFPGQLDAVIERGDELSLITNARSQPRSEQPLLITFRSADHTIRVLSYSGNEVCVRLAERRVCFEMLLTHDGKVILSGRDFLWTDEHPQRVAGCQIQAESLARL